MLRHRKLKLPITDRPLSRRMTKRIFIKEVPKTYKPHRATAFSQFPEASATQNTPRAGHFLRFRRKTVRSRMPFDCITGDLENYIRIFF